MTAVKIIHGILDIISILILLNVFLRKNLWKTICDKRSELLNKILGIIVLLITISVFLNILSDSLLFFVDCSSQYVFMSSFLLDRILTTVIAYFCLLIYRLADF